MISQSSLLSLLVLVSTVSAAPMNRAEYSFVPRMAITIHNEDSTNLKVLSLHMAGGDFFAGKGSNDIRFVHLTVDTPVDIEMSLRVCDVCAGRCGYETYTDYIHTFDTVCPEGGVGHEFTCEKGSGIKNLQLKLHNQWPNAEKFMQRDLMLFVTVESAEKDTLLSTWVYAKLH
ncbi:hypothetical protein PRIPAC_79103 [Pristionchus pacificus]|uniref:Uncharacterized protein n=1 Tax=Pristionchus pacificus TaxID=54126 RepID=A0A2A6BXN7_PRIPA|nr:hypothetical protein PRIPAC_79103 [Pristionchus pacificus]|eukprot:PDM70521.1 hypothetical protein PRIPAC_46767 [Pristionchus pacificus]